MSRFEIYTATFVLFLSASWLPHGAIAQGRADPTPAVRPESHSVVGADLFSKSTLIFAELSNPNGLVETLLNHPLRAKLESLPAVQAGVSTPQFLQFLGAVSLIELRLGREWPAIISALADQGLALGVDRDTKGVALVLRATDPEQLKKTAGGLMALVKENPSSNVTSTEYRGLKAYRVDQAYITLLGPNLLISNHQELAQSMVDRFLDHTADSLSQNEGFREQFSLRNPNATAWAYLDIQAIRESRVAEKLFAPKAENIAAELLVGGVLAVLRETESARLDFSITNRGIQLTANSPFESAWIDEPHRFFFGEHEQGIPPAALRPPQSLAVLTSYRDLSGLWLAKEDLFEERHIAELAQADSTLSTIFAGLDFGEQVLGATEPGVQIIVANQDYSKTAMPEPTVKIPGFALVFRVKDEQEIPQRFKIGFQSLIGFLNIQLGQQGLPQFDMDVDRTETGFQISTRYMVTKQHATGLINYNFSPSMVYDKRTLILSSTESLARELTDLNRQGGQAVPENTNTFLEINGDQMASIFQANRSALIAQNMLTEGNPRPEAEQNIDQLLELLKLVGQLKLNMSNNHQELGLTLGLEFANEMRRP